MPDNITVNRFSVPLSLRLSGSALKIIAVLSMVIDHCAYFLMEHGTPLYGVMRCFGRIAFPVFAFLIAEGFAHTRNRAHYFITILGFAIISEIPWYLLNGYDGTHNVMFTLAIGVVTLTVFDRLCEHRPLCVIVISLLLALAYWTGVDYDWRGVLMIVLFYMLRRQTIEPWSDRKDMCFPSQAVRQIIFTFPLMMHYGMAGAILASLVIFLYDGTRGKIKGAAAKYSFYAFYPMHLFAIAIL
ncbi:TraX family protein [Bacteroides acidifaciens]|uniref:TraX family protein n=1 Tax=Bacteroides acidifaciens TaxID=85831 RepID=UPI0025986FDC|nr:TraX family protein [Bacteroides acidifaciens]